MLFKVSHFLIFIFLAVGKLFSNADITYEKDFVKELVFSDTTKIGEIYISDPKVINVQVMAKNKVLLVAENIGRSIIRIKDKKGNVLLSAYINVQQKITPLKNMIADLYPNTNVDIKPYQNQVFLLGKVESPKIAKDIEELVKNYFKSHSDNESEVLVISKLEIELPIQVMLKVKIVELSRDVSKRFGIEWNTIGDGTDNSHALSFGSIINGAVLKNLSGDNEGVFKKFQDGFVSNWKYTKNGIAIDLSALLNILESESLITILAEPTIVALSGAEAKFTSGGTQAYSNTIVDQGGSTRTGTEFASYGVDVTFTPVVVSENLININLSECKVTIPGNSGNGEGTTRSISTTIQMADGQTVAIAGLQKKDYSTTSSRSGFFANLPIIGDMFGPNKALTSSETELVITITPYIIRPTKEQMYCPLDGASEVTIEHNGTVKKFDKVAGVTKDYTHDYAKTSEVKQ